ncbi:hypothetical protein HDU76_011914, partial [Blyttiomyces sp. JEL0837]
MPPSPRRKGRRNLLQDMPQELENLVWHHTDPFTKYINQRITLSYEAPNPNLEPTNLVGVDLWNIAFESGWEGNPSLLPLDELPT